MKNNWQRAKGGMSVMEVKKSTFHPQGQPSEEDYLYNRFLSAYSTRLAQNESVIPAGSSFM